MTAKSSSTAKVRAFLKTHVVPSPAAKSIEKSTPADVGAEESPAITAGRQGVCITMLKYKNHLNLTFFP